MFKRLRSSWFPVSASVPTATFLVLAFFCGPTADDFCYAQSMAEFGYFGAFKSNYLYWQGRYASTGILLLSGYVDHSAVLDWYWVVPTTLILTTVCSTYVLLYSLNRFLLESAFRRSQMLVASIVFTSIYLVSLERPSEVIFWFSGSVTYQLANVLFTFLLAVLVRLYFANSRTEKCLLFTASAMLVLFVVGSNETILAVTLSFLGSLVLWLCLSRYQKHTGSYRIMLLFLLVIGIIASLVVVLAPGNDIRIQYEEKTWGMHKARSVWEVFQAGLGATIWATSSSARWLLTQAYHPFAVLVGLVLATSLSRRVHSHVESRSLLWLPVIGFVLICVAALPSFYLGIQPPPRTTSGIYVIFWLSFIPSSVVLMRYYGWELHGSGLMTVLKIALVGSILLHPNYAGAIPDLKDAVLYRLQLHEREIMVSNAIHDGHRDLVVPRLMRVPATIHFRDLSEDKTHYYNKCYASYLGVNSIVARGDGDTSRLVRQLRDKVNSKIDTLVFWR